jgi:hypothetical protein
MPKFCVGIRIGVTFAIYAHIISGLARRGNKSSLSFLAFSIRLYPVVSGSPTWYELTA